MILYITPHAWDKLRAYTDNCNDEIGGMGKLRLENGNFYVEDVEIYDQVVTPGTVDLTAETLAKWQVTKIKAKESLAPYTFFWHSHANMTVFFSATDKTTINGSTEFPFLVSLVINHKHELVARLDIFKPVHVTVEQLTIKVLDTVNSDLITLCQQEIAEKVTRPVYTAPKRSTGFHTDYRDYLPGARRPLLPLSQTLPDLPYPVKNEEQDADEKQYAKLEERLAIVMTLPKNKKNQKAIQALEGQMSQILYQIEGL